MTENDQEQSVRAIFRAIGALIAALIALNVTRAEILAAITSGIVDAYWPDTRENK